MPYKFSGKSAFELFTCHKDLQKIFKEVIKHIDCTVIDGHRDRKTQDAYFEEGKSKLKYPKSKHNSDPARAIDVSPYPINRKDYKRFYYFAGIVLGIAYRLKDEGIITHDIRWGGDWDMDNDINDQNFNDLVHFEIV